MNNQPNDEPKLEPFWVSEFIPRTSREPTLDLSIRPKEGLPRHGVSPADERLPARKLGVDPGLSNRPEMLQAVALVGTQGTRFCSKKTCTNRRPSVSDAGCKPSVLGGAPHEGTSS